MRWGLDRILVMLGGLIFLGFGAWFLIQPEMVEGIGITLEGPTARADVRAVYGGFELGIGLLLVLCASRVAWHRVGLVAGACAAGGFFVGRLVGIALESGDVDGLMWGFLALEGSWTLVYLWALRRSSRSRE